MGPEGGLGIQARAIRKQLGMRIVVTPWLTSSAGKREFFAFSGKFINMPFLSPKKHGALLLLRNCWHQECEYSYMLQLTATPIMEVYKQGDYGDEIICAVCPLRPFVCCSDSQDETISLMFAQYALYAAGATQI